ncbi:MAG TPA: UrcA family protein [Hyphomonadaceae bacterium]|nr:UrcA family protein [Hyphomonadaceae bacterium]
MSRSFRTAPALILAAAILTPAAVAQSPLQPASIEVSHADLDLTAKAGAQTLLKRMQTAAQRICGQRPSPRQIQATVRHEACTREAMNSAVAALDVPTVTALFAGKTGTVIAAR